MSAVTIYHNPRCSKSRNTLPLLEEHGVSPDVIRYLDTPLDATQLRALLKMLGMGARELVRRGEADYKQAGLSADSTDAEVLAAMVKYPKLIQRPIVVKGDKAVLGRPPENALELIG